MSSYTRHILLIIVGFLLATNNANAVLQIEITEGVQGAAPIAVVPFGWEGSGASAPEDIAQIIADDLNRSGRFSPLPQKDFLSRPTEGTAVRFPDWKALGAESLVVGQVRAVGAEFRVQFQLFDVFRGAQLLGISFMVPKARELRYVAHQISDQIYEALTGQKGAFATRIAYITRTRDTAGKKRYSLQVADTDGENSFAVVPPFEKELMSPAWSPDGKRLAYVSFERDRQAIVVQELATGKLDRLLPIKDVNSAPAWSPDGKKIAFSMAKNGQRDIYIISLQSRLTTQLTKSGGDAINTEPVWSPDGNSVVFTSNRGGNPQLYKVLATGGQPQRITFEGNYNARGTFSPDGKLLAMVHGDGKGYHIAVLELATGTLRVVTETSLDESPSFAPNGSMVLYSTGHNRRKVLAAVSADGRGGQRFTQEGGDVLDPAWGPFFR